MTVQSWLKLGIVFVLSVLFIIFMVLLYRKVREKLIQGLIYSRSFGEEGIYEGEDVEFTETIFNPSFLPILFVDVEQYFYNDIPIHDAPLDTRKAMQYFTSRFHLMPFMKIRRRHVVRGGKRGHYKLEHVDIRYYKKVRYIDAPAELYVYPKMVSPTDIPRPSGVRQGDFISSRRLITDPFTVSGIRDYTFGDTFHSINFKATAKCGTLKVNQQDFCSNRIVKVIMNFQTNIDEPMETPVYVRMMERGLSYAAAIVREAEYAGCMAGFSANCMLADGETSIWFPLAQGDEHLKSILKEMAKVRPGVGISYGSLLEREAALDERDTEIYLLTPDVHNSEANVYLQELTRAGNYVHHIILEGREETGEDQGL